MKIPANINDGANNRIDFKPVFERLNEELSKLNILLELVCGGGFVMQLHGYRATVDVDAFFTSNKMIESAIRLVGDSFGINKVDELWLNNAISNLNAAPPAEYVKTVYQFSNLTVKAIDLTYLVGMKLKSGRELDLADVAEILKQGNHNQPLALLSELSEMGFDVDISMLLGAFGEAHGMEWLDQFFRDNEREISEYY